MEKIKERVEKYKRNLELVTEAVRKGREQLAIAERTQAQLEALIVEFEAVINEATGESDASSTDSGSAEEAGQSDPGDSMEALRGLSQMVPADGTTQSSTISTGRTSNQSTGHGGDNTSSTGRTYNVGRTSG